MNKLFVFIFFCIFAISNAQNLRLAENYLDKGEYKKALAIYEKSYSDNNRSIGLFVKLIEINQEMEAFEKVDSLIVEASSGVFKNRPELLVERGYNYSISGDTLKARSYYEKAISHIDSFPNSSYSIANRFEKRNLLDEAIRSFKKGMEVNDKANFTYQLARLYGMKGDLNLMFSEYLDLIETNASYKSRAQALFAGYVSENPESEGNQALRKNLLIRLRENPKDIYNELLSWLYIQQKQFGKAFTQEKAIYLRTKESMNSIKVLANTAFEEGADEEAKEILNYIVEESPVEETKYIAQSILMKIRVRRAQQSDYPQIYSDYKNLLDTYGYDARTYQLQLDAAQFIAFEMKNSKEGESMLKTLQKERLTVNQKAAVKMALADLLLLEEQFNRALILYSQIQNDIPNDELAQEAQFKVAQTSYFQGDFNWSITQLDVLKAATSKLIANDALELSLLIKDNIQEDTTFVALKAFAKADLKKFQNKTDEAITDYELLLVNHKGETIEDEALLRLAQLYIKKGAYEVSEKNYLKIIENYADGILADDAYYELGLLYENQLGLTDKAQEMYERIIYDHADSINFVDSRRRYRTLRGDENTKAF